MSKFFLSCVTFLALIANSALGQDVNVRYDHDTDFAKFKTYKWVTLKNGAAPIDSLTDEQIKAALDAALALKGLSKIDGDSSADLFIACQTTEKVEEQLPGYDPNTGFHTGSGGGSSWTIYKGELVVNLYVAANRKLIWMGAASKALDPKANAKKRQNNLNKAVQKLIKHYPPSGGDVPFEPGL